MTKAQDDYKALISKHRPKGGRGTGMGWVKNLSETVQKKIAAAKEAADASVDATISAGQRMAEAYHKATPGLYRGKSTNDDNKRRAAEKQGLKDDALVKRMEKRGALEKAGKSQRFRPAPLPVQKVDVLKKVPAKPPTKTATPALSAGNIKLHKRLQDAWDARPEPVVNIKKTDSSTEDTSWKKGHDPITKFMEELLGTKRTVAQVKKDMAASKASEDEMLEFYGKKKGGKVTAKRPTAKKYAMNRGGKVASVRKPTRA